MTTPSLPDARGRFGAYGGRFVPETLVPALDELEAAGARRERTRRSRRSSPSCSPASPGARRRSARRGASAPRPAAAACS